MIINKYDNKFKLLLTGTDSLMYKIKTGDVLEDFNSDKEMFDFSNYLTKSKCSDDSYNVFIGKMTDETSGVVIDEFSEKIVNIRKQMLLQQ